MDNSLFCGVENELIQNMAFLPNHLYWDYAFLSEGKHSSSL